MPDSEIPFLADESRKPEPTALRVFQIEEESDHDGPYVSYSCCWVTKESDGFYLYGNELGCMAGPCHTTEEALNVSMHQFGMAYWNIRCHLPTDDLKEILASPAFVLSNAGRVAINDFVAPTATAPAVVESYKQWRHGRVMDVTVIFGPPGPIDVQQRIEKRHEETGTSKHKLWVELVHLILRDLNTRPSMEESSAIDELFSDFMKRSVTVHDLFLTFMFMGGIQYPAFRFYPDKIADGTGWPVEFDWSNLDVQQAVNRLFGILIKSEWVRLSVAYDS